MTRVKIKQPRKTPDSKRRLLEILASHNVYTVDIKDTRDGYIVLPTRDAETDAIFQEECTKALQLQELVPVLPPKLKADRTILLFRLDNHIYENSEEDITNEIYRNNPFTNDAIDSTFKFPNARIVKITFRSSAIATKAKEQGLLLFNMKVPEYNIKKEEYTEITTCMKCYKLDHHYTNKCPEDTNFKVCSECGSKDHTWRDCSGTEKKCINCNGQHRTLSYQCPKRKEIINEKRTALQNTPQPHSYAAAAQQTTPNLNFAMPANRMDQILTCVIHAHLANAINPGSYQKELNDMLKANDITEVKVPHVPDSNKLFPTNTLNRIFPNITTPESPMNTNARPETTNQAQEEEETNNKPSDESSSEGEPETEEEEQSESDSIDDTAPPLRPLAKHFLRPHTDQQNKPQKQPQPNSNHAHEENGQRTKQSVRSKRPSAYKQKKK